MGSSRVQRPRRDKQVAKRADDVGGDEGNRLLWLPMDAIAAFMIFFAMVAAWFAIT